MNVSDHIRADGVSMDDESFERIRDELHATCDYLGGQGLSAPQIFLPYRIFVMQVKPTLVRPHVEEMKPLAVINPVILSQSEETEDDIEGCLSIPDIFAIVTRPKKIVAVYNEQPGRQNVRIELEGFAARVFLHELDHLDGILFVDRVTDWKKSCMERERKAFTSRWMSQRS